MKFCICIPTYKRIDELRLLLNDINNQTVYPNLLVIVDGYPQNEEVKTLLEALVPEICVQETVYVPSNHANLPYQRYLGWKVAQEHNCDILIYLDDDLRICSSESIDLIINTFIDRPETAGVTTAIEMGEYNKNGASKAVIDRNYYNQQPVSFLVKLFGGSKKIYPGNISPTGNRIFPINKGNKYEFIRSLSGGVMAFRVSSLREEHFSPDLFSMYERGYGKGEDKVLSCRIYQEGNLIFVFGPKFFHPNTSSPKAYSTKAFFMGYSTSFSRRLINENYRGLYNKPTFSDRFALCKSYLGVSIINWWRAITNPKSYRLLYALGYSIGALRGLLEHPSSKRLTPDIDWRKDADIAVASLTRIN